MIPSDSIRIRARPLCWALLLLFGLFPGLCGFCQSQPPSGNLLTQAKAAEEKHDYQQAASFYRQFLSSHPDQPEILQRLGLVYYLSRQYAKSIPVFESALKQDSSLWGSALFLGISYYRTGNFNQAEPTLRHALALKPELAEASFWLGSTLVAKGQAEAAIPYLRSASRDARLGIDADQALIEAYRKCAEDYYRRIAAISPDSYRVHQLKAQALEWEGKKNAALLEYSRALQLKPDLEGAHRAMGELYWQERQLDFAAREFSAELRLNPLDAESNLRLGEYTLAKGDASASIKYLKTAIAAKSTNETEARHYLEQAEKQLGRKDPPAEPGGS